MKDYISLLTNPLYRFNKLACHGLLNYMSDEDFIKKLWFLRMGYRIDLNNPQTFNEKLQWLKLHDRNPIYNKMVDKYEVKEFVSKIIGEKYIIPTLGIWNHFDEIDFDKLPKRFVLKCTHDSGGLVICKDKNSFDFANAKRTIEKCLKTNYFWVGREWPYKDIKPRVLAETYIGDEDREIYDYKLMCFGGKVKCSFVCTDRGSADGLKLNFYDNEWNLLPFERHYPMSKIKIQRPSHFKEMISIAEELSKGLPFVRVDLYEENDSVFFGELTLYPGCGLEEFSPEIWDYRLGGWIDLSMAYKN